MANQIVIEESTFSASQLKEMFGQAANGTLNGAHLQAFIEHRNPFAKVNENDSFNPSAYFVKPRKGLWVSKSFQKYALAGQRDLLSYRVIADVTNQTLARDMSHQETFEEFLGGAEKARTHAFTLDQLATLLRLQPNGEDGALLNNGSANIFYVLTKGDFFSVSMLWDSVQSEWCVYGWPTNGHGHWDAGDRVFRNMTSIF
ncbi:MAG: hypothetical protein HZB11_02535 [Candidatus Yonathbacteria bacterium]|nr:hypothetical protein [Candidatus Yonathbacteria bacterium]